MTQAAGRIFISHGSEDRAEADGIAAHLEARGMQVWIAPRDVRPGRDYSEQLQEAIEQCAAFLVLISAQSNKSPYVRVETELAFSRNKPIFPVRTSMVEPGPGLGLFLKIKHWTDAFGDRRDYNLERLVEELQLVTGTAPPNESRQEPAPVPQAPAPAPPPPPVAPQPTFARPPASPREAALRAFVGPNSDYYLGRWQQMAGGSQSSWNWAAFLLNGPWLLYRKMWAPAASVIGGFSLLFLAACALVAFDVVDSFVPVLAAEAAGAAAAAWVALNGNRLYRAEADKALAAVGFDEGALRLRGGTALPVAVGAGIVWGVLLGGASMLAAREIEEREGGASESATDRGPAPAPDGRSPERSDEQAADPQAMLNSDYLVGRWGDNGNCNAVFVFEADGTVLAPDGSQGQWWLTGDTLNVEGAQGTSSVAVRVIDSNRFALEGQAGETIRC